MRYQIDSDGKTVWVNSETGMCLARFSNKGIDIHKDFEAQLQGGSQCLDCKAGPCTIEDWNRFVKGMKEHYGIEESELRPHKPDYLDEVLYNADPNCEHDIKAQPSGGVKCTKCPGWFCF